jgi:prevent-host-death family protein
MTGHNMKSISATEAKARFAALLSDVERGETIEITRHGKTIARIVQPDNDDRERARIAVEQIRELKRTGRKTGITVEDILSARDEGRK